MRASAYKGVTVPGSPNFAIIYGPDTNLGHSSIILMIEAQSAYIKRLINAICANTTDVPGESLRTSLRASAFDALHSKLQAGLSQSTWPVTSVARGINQPTVKSRQIGMETWLTAKSKSGRSTGTL